MVGYRLISSESLLIPRSFCPHCKAALAWYDLFPLISWYNLHGKCRTCKAPISWLYPFIEALTVVLFIVLFLMQDPRWLLAYSLFFSALIISIRTDLDSMLLSRFVTIALIPCAFLFCSLNLLPITLTESIIGSITAALLLFTVRFIHHKMTGLIGLGQGDIELLAMIGAFIGVQGWCYTLLIGSCLGTIIGLYLYGLRARTPFPFGPFLAFGACTYVLFGTYLLESIG